MKLIHTNVWVFYDIAHEAYEAMQRLEAEGTKAKPNNEPGHIKTYDPLQRSFKEAITVIVFCGVYLEAAFHLVMIERLSKAKANELDRANYADKLKALGASDQTLFDECKNFSDVRREIVHEKAHHDFKKHRTAQSEAIRTIAFIEQINNFLGITRRGP